MYDACDDYICKFSVRDAYCTTWVLLYVYVFAHTLMQHVF